VICLLPPPTAPANVVQKGCISMKWLAKIACAALLAMLAALPARAEWLRAESPRFVVYSEDNADRLRERVAELEDFDALLRLLTGTPAAEAPSKLTVYLVRGYGQLRRIRPSLTSQVGGFYTAGLEGALAVSDTLDANRTPNATEILFHEYAHHFMQQYFPGVYPPWYTEGFAEYLMTVRFARGTIELGRSNAGRASFIGDHIRPLTLDRVLWGAPRDLMHGEVLQFYAQSWLFVHYMLRDRDRARLLNRYLVATSAGQDPREAFAEIFAVRPEQLQQQMLAYYRNGITFSRLPRPSASAPVPIAVDRMPAGSGDLVLLDAALRIGDGGEALLQRARREAGARSDPFARRVLARAEAVYGEGAAAERLLTALLADAPDDSELLYLMGMRHLMAARTDQPRRAEHHRTAAEWFARAIAAAPNHYPSLYRRAESLSTAPGFPSEEALDLLLRAHRIAPQSAPVRLSAAGMLIARGRHAEAEAMLLPLASQPHLPSYAQAAQELLVKARARTGPAPAVFPPAPQENGPAKPSG
jgi:hypothetical protein